jgi:hypothetical protein
MTRTATSTVPANPARSTPDVGRALIVMSSPYRVTHVGTLLIRGKAMRGSMFDPTLEFVVVLETTSSGSAVCPPADPRERRRADSSSS